MLVSLQPLSMQFRIAVGGLGERQAVPRAEIRLDQIVVDGDVQAQRLSRPPPRCPGTLQRRTDHRRDSAARPEITGGGVGLLSAKRGQRRIAAARIAPLHRQFGLAVPQQQQTGGGTAAPVQPGADGRLGDAWVDRDDSGSAGQFRRGSIASLASRSAYAFSARGIQE